ncbi:MAG: hypothetical protein DRP16_06045 [Candidatus Aenigmatarchaeota archaeon]|nr:MAG: hypothetical protein DRP16_06045 [Candidatus Aenigmarchaeota archaeon]
MKNIPLFQAIATLVGTIIGAGILGIPYVFAQAGFWTGVVVLVIVTFAMISIKLMFGEITLRTYGKHQVSGYVEKYLGKFWKNLTSFILVLAISGSLLAYFVGIGEVLSAVLGGAQIFWSLLFYILAAIFLYFGIKLIKNTEFILSLAIFLIVFIILLLSLDHFNPNNLLTFNLTKILLPYGVVLFACSGMVAVPEVREILFHKEHLFKKSIFLGALIPSLVYLMFAWIVISVTGESTTEVATVGLGNVMGPTIIIIGNVFAFFTISTSFLTVGLALKEIYNYDFKMPHFLAWLLTLIVPLAIYFLGLQDFIKIISLVGALGFGVNGVIYIFAYWQARKKSERQPEYALSKKFALPVSVFLVLVFVGGLIYTLVNIVSF